MSTRCVSIDYFTREFLSDTVFLLLANASDSDSDAEDATTINIRELEHVS